MKHSSFFWLSLLLFGVALSLSSCSEEVRFENWLTKDGGTWRVTTLEEKFVYYDRGDSTFSETVVSLPDNSFFTFSEEGNLSYNLDTEALFFDLDGEGGYTLDGELFRYRQSNTSPNNDPIELGMKGYKWKSKEMQIDLRQETYDSNGDYRSVAVLQFRLEPY